MESQECLRPMVYDLIQKSRQFPGATCSLPCPAVFSTCSGWVPCAHLIRQHLDSVSSESSRWHNVTQVSASHSQDPQVVSSSSSIAKGRMLWGRMLCRMNGQTAFFMRSLLFTVQPQSLTCCTLSPARPWFPMLLSLLEGRPWQLPPRKDMLSQMDGAVWHPDPARLQLWPLGPTLF